MRLEDFIRPEPYGEDIFAGELPPVSNVSKILDYTPRLTHPRFLRNVSRGVYGEKNYDEAARRAHVKNLDTTTPRATLELWNPIGQVTTYSLGEEQSRRLVEKMQSEPTPPPPQLKYPVGFNEVRFIQGTYQSMAFAPIDVAEALDTMNRRTYTRALRPCLESFQESFGSVVYQEGHIVQTLNRGGVTAAQRRVFMARDGSLMPGIHAKSIKIKSDSNIEVPTVLKFFGSEVSFKSQGDAPKWIIGGSESDDFLNKHPVEVEVLEEGVFLMNSIMVYSAQDKSFWRLNGYNAVAIYDNIIGIGLPVAGKKHTQFYRVGPLLRIYEWIVLFTELGKEYCCYGIFTILFLCNLAQKGWYSLAKCNKGNLDVKVGRGGVVSNSISKGGLPLEGGHHQAAARIQISYKRSDTHESFKLLQQFVRRSMTVDTQPSNRYYYKLAYHIPVRLGVKTNKGNYAKLQASLGRVEHINAAFERLEHAVAGCTIRVGQYLFHIEIMNLEPYVLPV